MGPLNARRSRYSSTSNLLNNPNIPNNPHNSGDDTVSVLSTSMSGNNQSGIGEFSNNGDVRNTRNNTNSPEKAISLEEFLAQHGSYIYIYI